MIQPFFGRTLTHIGLAALAAAIVATPSRGQTVRPEVRSAGIALELAVFDRDGKPLSGLRHSDFVVEGNGHTYPVATVEQQTAGEARRRFVFVFNRRGADAPQLSRARRGLEAFIDARLLDSDESLFADLGETLRIGRGFGPGKEAARAGLGTIPTRGYRSPAGDEEDAVVASRMLEIVADRLAAAPGRKLLMLFSGSLSSFSRPAEQPAAVRKPDRPRIRPGARGEFDAGLASISGRLRAASATVHVLHLAGVHEFEDRILTATRDELVVSGTQIQKKVFASSRQENRQQEVSPRSADDILSALAVETGGLYFARATGFRTALDRVEARHRTWYRLTLGGAASAGSSSDLASDPASDWASDLPSDLEVRISDCPECKVLAGT